jgi:hypothetical protein
MQIKAGKGKRSAYAPVMSSGEMIANIIMKVAYDASDICRPG